MSTLPTEVEVVLIGYGPVGAAIAGLLGRYGIRTLVVEKAAGIYEGPRAIALDNEALRILQMVGIEDQSFAKTRIPRVRLRSPYVGEFGCANTTGDIDGHPTLVTFFQPELERALRVHAEAHGSITVVCGVEWMRFAEDREGIDVVVRAADGAETTVRTRYLIGADGAASKVRAAIGEDFVGHTYGEDWLIVDALDVTGDFDHVEFLCDPHRPTPHMVAPGGRTRWEFMLRPGETREEMETDARITELIAPWAKSGELKIERKAVYRFHARACAHFSRGRVFLAGDAAHITPPFAGQGLVAGLRDAANLSWKLAWVLRGRASPTILDSYDEERRPHATKMIALAKLMGRVIMPRSRLHALVLHGAMALARKIPRLRRLIDGLGAKPENAFPKGLFVASTGRSRRGTWAPQATLRSPGGELRTDDLLGHGLTLVACGSDPSASVSERNARRWALAGGASIDLAASHELDERFVRRMVQDGGCVVLRPDRTILHDGRLRDADRIVCESLRLLGTPAA